MNDVINDRILLRVDMEHALAGPGGWRTPNTHSLHWFFEVPVARNTDEAWNELLNRIFYDSNVRMRSREPGDENWLDLVSFRVSPIDAAVLLAADANTWRALPWVEAERAKVWEVMPCYFIDDAGRYDVMTGADYSELILMRHLAAGKIDQAIFTRFFDRLFAPPGKPPVGQQIYEDRANRLNNLVVVRKAPYYQKPPGEKPWISGPVDSALIG